MSKEKIIKICEYIIEYGFLAIIFFIPLIFDFTAISYNVVDLYKMVIFRVILTLILLSYAAKIFFENKFIYRGGNIIFWLAAGLGLSFFISSLFSLHPNQSFWGSFLRQQGFYNYFNYLLFFVLLILNIKDFKQIRRIIMAVIAAASIASLYGLVQYFGLDPFRWSESANVGRIFSTFGQPNFFGHYLVLVLPFGLYALIFMAQRFWSRFFIGLAVLAQLFCLIFTYSRAAWIGFFASLVFLLLVWLISRQRKKTALGFIGLLLVGLITIIGLNIAKPVSQIYLNDAQLISRLKSLVDFNGGSGKMRLYYIESAVEEIKNASSGRLLVGFGPETLADIFVKYYKQDWGVYEALNAYADRAHNWLFDQILALGFLGLMANLAFYFYLIYKAAGFFFARERFGPEDWLLIFLFSALAAYGVNNLFSFSLFVNYVYLFLILAMAWLVINYEAKTREINIKLTNFSKLLIWAALLAVSAIFIWTNNINQARAEIYYAKALKSISRADCQSVMNNMEKVLDLSPNSSYYQEHYLFLMLNCFFSINDKAVREQLLYNMLERVKLVDDNRTYGAWQNIARAYTLFGFYFDKAYYLEAEKIFNKLIEKSPYLTTVYEDLNKQKLWQEDYPGAIDIYKRELAVLPSTDNPYLNDPHRFRIAAITAQLYEGLGQAYFKMQNYGPALESYKQGLKYDPYRATLYKNIADIYYVQGRLDEAIAWNKRGFILNSTDYHWPLSLSLLYRDKKDLAKSKEYLDKAMKLAPENGELKKYEQELNK